MEDIPYVEKKEELSKTNLEKLKKAVEINSDIVDHKKSTIVKDIQGNQKKIDPERDYLEDSIMFYQYEEYKKTIEYAFIVYKYSTNQLKKEEALYLINEAAEQIILQLERDLYIAPIAEIEDRISMYKKECDVNIILDKIGYQYLVYYDKEYYKKLKSLNPNSEFVKKIELKHIARMGQFVTNPAYRYKQIINVTRKYWEIVTRNPDLSYAPDILVKIADLYLYLSEEGVNVRRELNISQNEIHHYYTEAGRIYKRVKKEYPRSAAAQSIAYVIDSVRLRDSPDTKAKVIKRIQAGTLVKIIDRSAKKVAISNMYAYWFKVKLISGLEGWVYGFYLRSQY